MKTKLSKTLCKRSKKQFLKNTTEKLWVDKRAEYGGAFMKFCKEKQPKAAHAERAKTKI